MRHDSFHIGREWSWATLRADDSGWSMGRLIRRSGQKGLYSNSVLLIPGCVTFGKSLTLSVRQVSIT